MKSLILGAGVLATASLACLVEAAPMSRSRDARVAPRSHAIGRIARPAAPVHQAAANRFIRTPAQFESPRSPWTSGFSRFHDRDRFTENGFRHGHFRDRDRERAFFVTPLVVALGWPFWNNWYWPDWSYYDDPNDYTLQDPNNDYQVAIPQSEKWSQSESQRPSDRQSENQFYSGLLTGLALRASEHRVSTGFPPSGRPSQGAYSQNPPQPGQNQELGPEVKTPGTPLPQPGAAPSDTSRNLPGVAAASPGQRTDSLPKHVLLSWFKEGGKEVALVEDTESKKVERITAEPNSDHLRLVEVHSDINPQLSEVVISDGQKQETVRFAPL
jgi:hypothetical protein